MLPIHVSDTAANSQDGLSPKFVAGAAAMECNIQDARGGWLCLSNGANVEEINEFLHSKNIKT